MSPCKGREANTMHLHQSIHDKAAPLTWDWLGQSRSVGRSACRSVGPSAGRSVGRLVGFGKKPSFQGPTLDPTIHVCKYIYIYGSQHGLFGHHILLAILARVIFLFDCVMCCYCARVMRLLSVCVMCGFSLCYVRALVCAMLS